MSNNLTIKGKNFNPKLATISDKPSVMDSGAKYVYVGYNGKNLIVQTPKMYIPFGMNVYDKGEYPKYSVELSFQGMDEDKSLREFHDNIMAFDDFLIEAGVKNSTSWFKKKKASKEVISALFNPQLKVPTDKETGEELTQYPKRLRLKIPFKNDKFECEFYDTQKNKLEDPIEDILVKGATGKAIIQCVGLWISSSNYMCQWKLVRMEVDVPQTVKNIDFLPDTDDEEDDSSSRPATNDQPSNVVDDDDEDDDDDDDDEDDDDDDDNDDDDDDDEEEERTPTPPPEPKKKAKSTSKGKGKSKN